jgi:RNA polymerase sigma factor (sigma-70 family)
MVPPARSSSVRRPPPFQRFLDEQRALVYRYLLATVGPNDADDVFQETFLAAMRAYPRLAHGEELRAWVLRIATRKAIDAGRRRARRAVPTAELPEVPAPPVPDGEPALWRAVRTLPPKQRAAVVHRYVHDLPYAQVGELIGCSPESARANAYQGVRRLREIWEET